jgi:hypothetical protein
MRDRVPAAAGLVVVLAVLCWPVWRTLAAPPPHPPDLVRPVGAANCVAPTDYMRASHMTLLQGWRDQVVRDGVRTFRTADGRAVPISLTGTCLRACHTDKTTFCDRCHEYAGVKPTCWECHVWERPAAADRRQP